MRWMGTATALLVFAALAAALLMGGQFAAGSDTATVRIGSAVVPPGGTETVTLEVLNVAAPPLCAVTVDIIYDQTVKTATACDVNPAKANFGMALCNEDAGPNKISFTAIEAEDPPTGDFPLANITFDAIGDPGDFTTLDVVVRKFADCNGEPIPVNDEDGTNRIRFPDGAYGTLYADVLPDANNTTTGFGAIDVCTDTEDIGDVYGDDDGLLEVGERFSIDIVIQGANDLAGAYWILYYDNTVLQVAAHDWGSWRMGPDGISLTDSMPDTDGQFSCAYAQPAGVNGNGVLLRVTLEAIANGSSDLRLCTITGECPDVADSEAVDHFYPEVLVHDPDGDVRVVVGGYCPGADSDGDTIRDDDDNCPDEAEDADGCCDLDGCPETDCDEDAMSDTYETDNSCLNPQGNDAGDDADSDELSNIAEMNAGTDPCDPDTDGDSKGQPPGGIPPGGFCSDGAEYFMGTDPLDDCADDTTSNNETGAGESPWPPDFNDTGKTDIGDLVALKNHWVPLGKPYGVRYDLNANGKCDMGDLVVLKTYWEPPVGGGYHTCDVG